MLIERGDGTRDLLHEVDLSLDECAAWMAVPDLGDSGIDRRCVRSRLGSHRVLVVVAARVWGPEVHDARIPRERGLACRLDLGEQLVHWPGPVRRAVDDTSIAEDERHVLFGEGEALELVLHPEDRALRGLPPRIAVTAWKPASEQHTKYSALKISLRIYRRSNKRNDSASNGKFVWQNHMIKINKGTNHSSKNKK